MEEMLYVVLFTFFSLPLIFTLVAASISHFLTATIKFSCYSSKEIDILCFLISDSSSFSVIHANADLKWSRKKVQAAERRGYLKCKISPRFTWRGGRTYGRFSQNQNFEMQRFTKFSYLRCSAARALRARAPLWKRGTVLGLWYFPVV